MTTGSSLSRSRKMMAEVKCLALVLNEFVMLNFTKQWKKTNRYKQAGDHFNAAY